MNTEHITPFIHLLDTDAETKAKAKALMVNDWDGLVKLAAEAGITATAAELQAALPSRFYQGHGQRPDKGWHMPPQKVKQLKTKAEQE